MELNAEQVIKALKVCGEYTHGTTCNSCPYMHIELADNEICSNRLSQDALALIKQLTEDVERVRKQCGEIIVECDERDAERLKQVAELTKENEDLKAIAEGYQKQFEDCYEEKSKLTEENERLSVCTKILTTNNADLETELALTYDLLEESKADTVREVQTKFAMCFGTYTDKDMTPITEVFKRLNQIAEEMLEGTNGTNT